MMCMIPLYPYTPYTPIPLYPYPLYLYPNVPLYPYTPTPTHTPTPKAFVLLTWEKSRKREVVLRGKVMSTLWLVYLRQRYRPSSWMIQKHPAI